MKNIFLFIFLSIQVSCVNTSSEKRVYEFHSLEDIINCPPELCSDNNSKGKFGSKSVYLSGLSLESYHISHFDTLEAYYYEEKLKQLIVYRNAVKHGTVLEFNEKGVIVYYGQNDYGKASGMCKLYDEKGHIREVALIVEGKVICSEKY